MEGRSYNIYNGPESYASYEEIVALAKENARRQIREAWGTVRLRISGGKFPRFQITTHGD